VIAFSTTSVASRDEVGKGKPPMPPGDMRMGPDGKLTGMNSGGGLRGNIEKAMKNMGAGGMD
jgi:hypothetical protein|tara:strand:- start:65 stop:250 length:186 start_codon:yes stop_codon:yes gene_type:complete